jgi:hypothetical protein
MPTCVCRKIIHGQAEIGENFFHGNSLAAALPEPGFRANECFSLFLRYGLVVLQSCGDSAGDWIEQHELQETYRCVNLGWSEALDQIVGVLLV